MQNFLPVACRITIWALQQNGRTMWLTVVSCTLTKICFSCINHVYIKFRTSFFIDLVNMLHTNEADFSQDTTWQDNAYLWHFVLVLGLLSGDWSQISRNVSNESSNTQKISIDPQCNYRYPGYFEKFYAKYYKTTHSCTFCFLLLISDITSSIFAHNITLA